MKLLVWLGNPWDKYKLTRHNIWFEIIEKFCDQNWFSSFSYENKFKWEISYLNDVSNKIIALKPMTYMNLSWQSISSISNFYKIDFKDILLIYDDIDLPLSKIRLRLWWSAWGHNWVKSTISSLWTDQFYRLKVWIDRPQDKSLITQHVLSRFKKDELDSIFSKYDEIDSSIKSFIDG